MRQQGLIKLIAVVDRPNSGAFRMASENEMTTPSRRLTMTFALVLGLGDLPGLFRRHGPTDHQLCLSPRSLIQTRVLPRRGAAARPHHARHRRQADPRIDAVIRTTRRPSRGGVADRRLGAHGTTTPGQKTCAPSLSSDLDGGLTRDGCEHPTEPGARFYVPSSVHR